MNINTVKNIVEKYSIMELLEAENALLNEESLKIEIEGKDEGEQLTHILAAVFCKDEMAKENININQAIRLYSQRVRGSIN